MTDYIKTVKAYEGTEPYIFISYAHKDSNEVLPLIWRGACAFVYTQVSDVEDEINGFITYDRQVVKVDCERLKSINESLKNLSNHK